MTLTCANEPWCKPFVLVEKKWLPGYTPILECSITFMYSFFVLKSILWYDEESTSALWPQWSRGYALQERSHLDDVSTSVTGQAQWSHSYAFIDNTLKPSIKSLCQIFSLPYCLCRLVYSTRCLCRISHEKKACILFLRSNEYHTVHFYPKKLKLVFHYNYYSS